MTRSPLHRLYDIIFNAENAIAAIEGKSGADLETNWQLSAAVRMAIVIIAEAARDLPPDLTMQYPEIPWADVVGMGNVLKHQYHHASGAIVWKTASVDLPVLLSVARRMVARLDAVVLA